MIVGSRLLRLTIGNQTVPQVYKRIPKLLFEIYGTMDFLSWAEKEIYPGEKSKYKLPSWAPDFSVPGRQNTFLGRHRDLEELFWVLFSPTLSARADCTFDSTRDRCSVVGFRIDTVKCHAICADSDPNSEANGVTRIRPGRAALSVVELGSGPAWREENDTPERVKKLEDFWKTILAGQLWKLESIGSPFRTPPVGGKEAFRLLFAFRDPDFMTGSIIYRQLIRSESGRLGLGPRATEDGDIIVLDKRKKGRPRLIYISRSCIPSWYDGRRGNGAWSQNGNIQTRMINVAGCNGSNHA
jgi:hypothetical protein